VSGDEIFPNTAGPNGSRAELQKATRRARVSAGECCEQKSCIHDVRYAA
jgi:hypothetical protein